MVCTPFGGENNTIHITSTLYQTEAFRGKGRGGDARACCYEKTFGRANISTITQVIRLWTRTAATSSGKPRAPYNNIITVSQRGGEPGQNDHEQSVRRSVLTMYTLDRRVTWTRSTVSRNKSGRKSSGCPAPPPHPCPLQLSLAPSRSKACAYHANARPFRHARRSSRTNFPTCEDAKGEAILPAVPCGFPPGASTPSEGEPVSTLVALSS